MFLESISLIHNLSMLVALSALSGFILEKGKSRGRGAFLQGMVFGSAAVIGMLNPFVLKPGLIFDGRSVVISLCGLFFGPLAAGVAGGMALVCRVLQGGEGTPMGVSVILSSAALGTFFHARWVRRGVEPTALQFLGFGFVVHAAMLLLAFTLPVAVALTVLGQVGLPIIVVYPLATLLIGKVLSDHEGRSRAVAALQETEGRLRRAVINSPFPIMIHAEDGEVVMLSNAWTEITGYSHADIPTTDAWTERAYGERKHIVQEEISRRYSLTRVEKDGEYQIRTKDGAVRVWDFMSAGLGGLPGGRRLAISTAVDITERKRAEEALRESTELFSLFMLHSPIYAYIKVVTPTESRVLQASDNYNLMLGIRGADMVGKTMAELFPADLAAKMTADDWAVVTSGEVLKVDEDLNGRHYTSIKFPIVQGGRTLLAGYTIDITERKLVEEALRESERFLRESQAIAGVGSYALDITAGTWRGSAVLDEVFGIDEGFDRSTEGWASLIHPDDRHEMTDYLAQEVVGKRLRFDREYRIIRHSDQAERWVHGLGELEFDEGGRPVGMLGTIQDITHRKKVERQLAQYSERLEEMVEERTSELRDAHERLVRQERLAVLGQLAGSVGHELRNPLGVITNAIYFLKMIQPDADDKVKEYLHIIENETRVSNKIISDLLDFTRIKSIDREPAPVAELIRQTLERFPVPPTVEVVLDLPADLPQVLADPHHVVQVLGNLTVNACQAMPGGGTLSISADVQGSMVCFAVRDTGGGIPPEMMEKVFEPLFTTKTKGIGLGLAVSKKLVEANEGLMKAESTLGAGSTFTVCFSAY